MAEVKWVKLTTDMFDNRKNHKLDEWHTLCEAIEKLPYSEIITGGGKGK